MSSVNNTASATVRRQRSCGNPCSIMTTVFMFLLVIGSHVVFYQSTIVHLPQRQQTSDNVSRHQPSTARTISSRWTSMDHLSASTTLQNSSNSTISEERLLAKTDVELVRLESGIGIRNNNVVKTEGRKSEKLGMESEKISSVNQTEIEDLSPPRTRGGVRDNGGPANWKKGRSRLLTSADNQSSTSSPSTSSSDSSTHGLFV